VCELREQGYKEVVLLGQNVNSYWDKNSPSEWAERASLLAIPSSEYQIADGFTQRSKPKVAVSSPNDGQHADDKYVLGGGVRFGEMLLRVSEIDPEMRIRFQAPHPKDFPDDVLHLISRLPNVCNSLHMPAQHGSTSALERMQRGYSREAYLSLVGRAREIIAKGTPEGVGLGLSSDFISGFCGETEEEHKDMLSLISEVGFDQAFTYSYSRREQTYAGLFYTDDVPSEVKARRLAEVIDVFQNGAMERNNRLEVGRLHLVLIEGEGRQSRDGSTTWTGRTDTNKRVLFEDRQVFASLSGSEALDVAMMPSWSQKFSLSQSNDAVASVLAITKSKQRSASAGGPVSLRAGDYCVVKILRGRGHTLLGAAVAKLSLTEAHSLSLPTLPCAVNTAPMPTK